MSTSSCCALSLGSIFVVVSGRSTMSGIERANQNLESTVQKAGSSECLHCRELESSGVLLRH